MMELAHQPDGLVPPEALLDQLALALADRVACMPGGPAIDHTAAPIRILSDMGSEAPRPYAFDKGFRVVELVRTQRTPALTLRLPLQHRQRRIALGRSRGVLHF